MLYLESDDFRVLSSVETGMRNHELVPAKMVCAIAELRSGVAKVIRNLCYNRLVSYERGKRYDGYRLTNLGYDYLALRVLRNRGFLTDVGNQIGVGKEASVYIAQNQENGDKYALKVHRLGRTSFKTVFSKRDYHRNRVCNWLYMSRLAALREFSFMKALHKNGFPVPEPVDNNRHCVLMRWIDGTLLNNITSDDSLDHEKLFERLMNMILELANKYGVVHGDFNEFNILIDNKTDEPVLIDFPQMVPTNHKLAKEYFERDVKCIETFFEKRFNFVSDETIDFNDVEIDTEEHGYIYNGIEDADFMHPSTENQQQPIEEEEENLLEEELDEKSNQQNILESKNFENSQISENVAPKTPTYTNDISNTSLHTEEMVLKLKELGVYDERRNEQDTEDHQNKEANLPDKLSFSSDNDNLSMISNTRCSRFGTSSVASSFTPDQIRSKIKKEKERKAKRELISNTFRKVKGDSSAVVRKRQDNKIQIREDGNIFNMF